MRIEPLNRGLMEEVKTLSPTKHGDDRGFFSEVYRSNINEALDLSEDFIQDNHAFSRDAWVLRGLHYQSPPKAQDKLIRVVRGSIWDVVVDIRKSSTPYGQWLGVKLSAENWQQLFVPKGFAHGYLTLEENTEVVYKVTNPYAPDHDHGIAWDDPDINIDWQLPEGLAPTLSTKDQLHPQLKDAETHFIK